MATNDAESDDRQLSADSNPMTLQESKQFLSQICKTLSRQTSPQVIAVANDKDTQQLVETQLLPLTFELQGLTTPISVIVSLLFHCFLLHREHQESKGQEEEILELRGQLRKLKELYDGVVLVNEQWALDYEKLQQQIANTRLTGFTTPTSSRSHGDVLMSPSTERCFECYINKAKVRDSVGEVERVRGELREARKREEAIKRERDQAVSENRAIQFQLQELGDLRAAMAIKEEFPRRIQEIKSLKRQHQDEICARIKLEKQIERLRRVFSDLFPATPTKPESGRGHITYPPHLRPCHTQQQFYSDPGPPTPPGLIARGQLTSLVERDVQSLTQQQSDERVISMQRPLVRLESSSPSHERWASDPHLNIERTQLVNGHVHSLAPPTSIPVRSRSFRNRRPRSLFDEHSDVARSLVDVRNTSSDYHGDGLTNQFSLPEGGIQSTEVHCPGCGEGFQRGQADSYSAFEHIRKCGT